MQEEPIRAGKHPGTIKINQKIGFRKKRYEDCQMLDNCSFSIAFSGF
jgi:hypothetical protein